MIVNIASSERGKEDILVSELGLGSDVKKLRRLKFLKLFGLSCSFVVAHIQYIWVLSISPEAHEKGKEKIGTKI